MSYEVGGPGLGSPYGKGPQSAKRAHKVYVKIANYLKKQHNANQKGPFLKIPGPLGSSQEMKFLGPRGGGGGGAARRASRIFIG